MDSFLLRGEKHRARNKWSPAVVLEFVNLKLVRKSPTLPGKQNAHKYTQYALSHRAYYAITCLKDLPRGVLELFTVETMPGFNGRNNI